MSADKATAPETNPARSKTPGLHLDVHAPLHPDSWVGGVAVTPMSAGVDLGLAAPLPASPLSQATASHQRDAQTLSILGESHFDSHTHAQRSVFAHADVVDTDRSIELTRIPSPRVTAPAFTVNSDYHLVSPSTSNAPAYGPSVASPAERGVHAAAAAASSSNSSRHTSGHIDAGLDIEAAAQRGNKQHEVNSSAYAGPGAGAGGGAVSWRGRQEGHVSDIVSAAVVTIALAGEIFLTAWAFADGRPVGLRAGCAAVLVLTGIYTIVATTVIWCRESSPLPHFPSWRAENPVSAWACLLPSLFISTFYSAVMCSHATASPSLRAPFSPSTRDTLLPRVGWLESLLRHAPFAALALWQVFAVRSEASAIATTGASTGAGMAAVAARSGASALVSGVSADSLYLLPLVPAVLSLLAVVFLLIARPIIRACAEQPRRHDVAPIPVDAVPPSVRTAAPVYYDQQYPYSHPYTHRYTTAGGAPPLPALGLADDTYESTREAWRRRAEADAAAAAAAAADATAGRSTGAAALDAAASLRAAPAPPSGSSLYYANAPIHSAIDTLRPPATTGCAGAGADPGADEDEDEAVLRARQDAYATALARVGGLATVPEHAHEHESQRPSALPLPAGAEGSAALPAWPDAPPPPDLPASLASLSALAGPGVGIVATPRPARAFAPESLPPWGSVSALGPDADAAAGAGSGADAVEGVHAASRGVALVSSTSAPTASPFAAYAAASAPLWRAQAAAGAGAAAAAAGSAQAPTSSPEALAIVPIFPDTPSAVGASWQSQPQPQSREVALAPAAVPALASAPAPAPVPSPLAPDCDLWPQTSAADVAAVARALRNRDKRDAAAGRAPAAVRGLYSAYSTGPSAAAGGGAAGGDAGLDARRSLYSVYTLRRPPRGPDAAQALSQAQSAAQAQAQAQDRILALAAASARAAALLRASSYAGPADSGTGSADAMGAAWPAPTDAPWHMPQQPVARSAAASAHVATAAPAEAAVHTDGASRGVSLMAPAAASAPETTAEHVPASTPVAAPASVPAHFSVPGTYPARSQGQTHGMYAFNPAAFFAPQSLSPAEAAALGPARARPAAGAAFLSATPVRALTAEEAAAQAAAERAAADEAVREFRRMLGVPTDAQPTVETTSATAPTPTGTEAAGAGAAIAAPAAVAPALEPSSADRGMAALARPPLPAPAREGDGTGAGAGAAGVFARDSSVFARGDDRLEASFTARADGSCGPESTGPGSAQASLQAPALASTPALAAVSASQPALVSSTEAVGPVPGLAQEQVATSAPPAQTQDQDAPISPAATASTAAPADTAPAVEGAAPAAAPAGAAAPGATMPADAVVPAEAGAAAGEPASEAAAAALRKNPNRGRGSGAPRGSAAATPAPAATKARTSTSTSTSTATAIKTAAAKPTAPVKAGAASGGSTPAGADGDGDGDGGAGLARAVSVLSRAARRSSASRERAPAAAKGKGAGAAASAGEDVAPLEGAEAAEVAKALEDLDGALEDLTLSLSIKK